MTKLSVCGSEMIFGGFVAGASHDTILEEIPVENIVAMFDAIREVGGYDK